MAARVAITRKISTIATVTSGGTVTSQAVTARIRIASGTSATGGRRAALPDLARQVGQQPLQLAHPDGPVGGVAARGELLVREPAVRVVRLELRDRQLAVFVGGAQVALQDRHATRNGSAPRR